MPKMSPCGTHLLYEKIYYNKYFKNNYIMSENNIYTKWIEEASVITQEQFDNIKSRPRFGTDFGSKDSVGVTVAVKRHQGIFYINETSI